MPVARFFPGYQFTSGFRPLNVQGSAPPIPNFLGTPDAMLAAVSDSDDTTGVNADTTFTAYGIATFFTWQCNPRIEDVMGPTARIDWLRVDYRARHVGYHSFMWVADLRGYTKGTNIGHVRPLAPVDPGSIAAAVAPIAMSTATTTGSADGVLWRDQETFHCLVGHYGPDGALEGAWDSSNYPYLTKLELVIGYTVQPTVTNITPTGTVLDPRPTVAWSIGNPQETQNSAHRLVVVPAGSVDAAGVARGDPGFDPTTGSGVAFDSGKTLTTITQHYVDKILGPATWYLYVKQWIGTGIDEYASAWTASPLVVNVPTVDPPTISLDDDSVSNTLKVQVAPGSHTHDLVALTIEVQYLDPVYGWVAAPIANSMVNGTGASVFYDGLHAPNESVSYRARGIGVNAGLSYASDWVQATHTVADLHQWWLRSTVDYTLNRSLSNDASLLMRSWSPTRSRPNATTWGIGGRPATVVHDITKGDVHDCVIWAMDEAAYLSLRALLEDGDDLVLVNPWGELWRVQPGSQVKEEVMRAAPRSFESAPVGFVRSISVGFVEVVTP